MQRIPVVSQFTDSLHEFESGLWRRSNLRSLNRFLALASGLWLALAAVSNTRGVILWSDLGATLVHDTGAGSSFLTGSAMDILGGAVKEDDSSTNTLYFKFHVDPLSDVNTEEYFAAFELYEGDTECLALGNSLKARTYSAFNTYQTGEGNKVFGDVDLHSATAEPAAKGVTPAWEFPRRGNERTIVFKIQYCAGGKDLATVWLNPDLSPGATEAGQSKSLTTTFTAYASFNQIRLRHGGGGGGWTFSDMAIATSFDDFVTSSAIEAGGSNKVSEGGPLSYMIQNWQHDKGLPQSAIRALAQTHDGYIWLGTEDGLLRFDGLRFVSFGLREGLQAVPVSELLADSHGGLWIGSGGAGLSRLLDGKFSNFTIKDGLPDNSITALAQAGEGEIWIGTGAGLVVWRGNSLAPVRGSEEFKGRTITALFKDRQGTIWMGVAGAGVFHYLKGEFVPVVDSSVEGLLLDPHCLLVDQVGRLWIGAGDDFVLCHENGEWHRYRIPRHLARPYISALAEEPDGTVWAGSISEGLFQFRGGKLAQFNASSGLSDNLVESLLVDREGKLWVGTDSGLNRLRRRRLFAFGLSEGLGYGPVQGMEEIAPDEVVVAKPGDGLYRWDTRRFSRVAGTEFSGRDLQFHSLIRDPTGGCWVACANGVLHFPDAAHLNAGPNSRDLPGLNILALTSESPKELWAGAQDGTLWVCHENHWVLETNFSQTRAITTLAPDRSGGLWIGTDGGGLYRFKNAVTGHWDKNSGLLSDGIRTVYRDAAGILWIGTSGGGLSRWDNGHIATLTAHEGLPDNTISQILEDSSGRLWLGSNRGIARISKHELEEFAGGKAAGVFPKIFGLAEGMVSEDCTGGFCPAGLKTRSGLLWFSTAKGIVVADARPRASDAIPPKALLEGVLVDGVEDRDFQPQEQSRAMPAGGNQGAEPSRLETLRLPPGRHRMEFLYTGLGFDTPEQMRFRCRLQGLEPEWVEAGTLRRANYNYVPPGHYVFHVAACNSDGVWDETGAGVALVVPPFFWQRWWVITLAGLGLLALIVGTVRIVEKRKLHRQLLRLEQEGALQRERERIAQDLHDDLGSSLARISLLSGLAKADKNLPAQVETHVDKISLSAAQTVRALEEIVWAVRPGSDSLQSLVEYIAHFASELFEGNSTRCRLDLPHDLPSLPLPPDIRHNLFLIVKEALTNALKHSAAKEVRVQAKAANGWLEFVIQDDGRGFAGVESPRADGKGNGMGNMRRRAEVLGATLSVKSSPGTGATVTVAIQLSGIASNGTA